MVTSLIKLPKKVGQRFYFSFSYAINCCRSEANGTGKLEAAMAAVPDDRILLESDMNTFKGIDGLNLEVCESIARVKGWTVEETARRTGANAERFFGVVPSVSLSPFPTSNSSQSSMTLEE